MNRIDYVTRKAHGNHPVGSKCLASRDFGILILEFENGDVVKLPGHEFYCEGIEQQPKSYYDKLTDSIAREIAREIDEEILGEIFRSAEEK